MKKTLLSLPALALCTALGAQQSNHQAPKLRSEVASRAATYHKIQEMEFSNLYSYPAPAARSSSSQATAAAEVIIGNTNYPLQTNSSMHDRIVYNSDGTIGATWTYSAGAWNTWADRGTGYAFYDGSAWSAIPTSRLENDRTGFTNIQVLGNGGEVTVAHNTNALLQHFMMRPGHGTGTWTDNTSLIAAPANFTYGTWWPQMAVGGTSGDYIHHIAISATTGLTSGGGPYTNGQDGAILYSRSSDNGQTFGIQNQVLAAFDPTRSPGYGADSYAIDAKGSTVAIVAGGFGEDVVLAKSTDNGNNWTTTVVHDFPIPVWDIDMITDTTGDGIADTLTTNDASLEVLIDNNGMCHVFYGNMRILDDDSTNATVSYFPGTIGLMHWSEATNTRNLVFTAVDSLTDGTLNVTSWGNYQSSLTSHPSAGIDAAGNIYVTFDAIMDMTDDGNGKSYRNVYVCGSADGGATWGDAVNVARDEYYEKVYPAIARNVDSKVRIIYQRDDRPGHGVGTNNPDTDNAGVVNDIIYVEIPTSAVLIGVAETPKSVSSVEVYPNPANDMAAIAISMQQNDEVMVTVHNTLGQTVSSFTQNLPSGVSKLDLNVSNYESGVYFVSVRSGNSSVTEKMVIR